MTQKTFKTIQSNLAKAQQDALFAEAKTRGLDPVTVRGRGEPPDNAAIRDLFRTGPPLALIAFDTPGIQRYVFKATRPGDRQGGSNFVAELTRPSDKLNGGSRNQSAPSVYRRLDALQIGHEAVVWAGAGGGLLLVAACQASAVCRELESALDRLTAGDLKTAAASLPIWPRDLRGRPPAPGPGHDTLAACLAPARTASRYARTLAALNARLDVRRGTLLDLDDGISSAQMETGKVCESCGERAATDTRTRGTSELPVCALCLKRGASAGKNKKVLEQATTTLDLFPAIHGRRRLAILYADGANFGAAFLAMETAAQHQALSRAVDEAFAAGVAASLTAANVDKYQMPILGGDDLVILMPAGQVFDFARSLIREIEQRLSLKGSPLLHEAFATADRALRKFIGGFGVGIGIAIADATFPDQILLTYAKELLTSAKRKIYESKIRSAIDFMVLRSGNPLNGSVQALRQAHFQRLGNGRHEPALSLTGRPYSAPTFESFIDHTQQLADTVPASQVHAVDRALDAGYQESASFFRYQNARDAKATGRGWGAYRRARGASLAEIDKLLWQELGDGTRETYFRDMVEIFDLFAKFREVPA